MVVRTDFHAKFGSSLPPVYICDQSLCSLRESTIFLQLRLRCPMQHSPNPVLSPPEPTLVVANDDGDGFTTVAQRTYDQLRQALLNGEFLPGQSISLRSTAEALGISQMPVRQALSRLQAEGILVMHENRTLTVPKLTPALIMEKRDIRIAL